MILRAALAIMFNLGTTCAFSQDSLPSKSTATCSFSEVYAKGGWTIPGLEGAKPQHRQEWNNKPGFAITQLLPGNAETFISPDVWCPYDQPGRLDIYNRPIRVMILASWDYKGKVFGYAVSYALQNVERGVRTELGAASTVQFLDIDGSGRFTVMRHLSGISDPFVPPMIPSWVQDQMKNGQQN